MASRRRSRAPEVSLFPFLSVLACVIGTLTLLIAAIALGQMGTDEFFVQWRGLQKEIQDASESMAQMTDRLADARGAIAEVASARAALEALGFSPDQSLEEQRRAAERQSQAESLQREQRTLETRLADVRTRVEGQRVELARLANDRRGERPIMLKPAGSGRNLTPFFVECRFDELVVYDAQHREDMRVARQFVEHSWDFRRFLGSVRDDRTSTVIFLIRPDGVDVFERARRAADRVRVRNGKIPLPGYGKLDFSEVENEMELEGNGQ